MKGILIILAGVIFIGGLSYLVFNNTTPLTKQKSSQDIPEENNNNPPLQQEEDNKVLAYTTYSTNKIDKTTGEGTLIISKQPINYQDKNGNWYEYDTTLVKSKDKNYSYQLTSADFQVYFKSSPESHLIKFIKEGYEMLLSPQPLEYINESETQLIAKPKANPEIETTNNTIIYKDLYGKGIDLKFIVTPSTMAKELIINSKSSLPTPKINDAKLSFSLGFTIPTNTSISASEGFWNREKIQTTKTIIVSSNSGESILEFTPPFAFDSHNPKNKITTHLAPGFNTDTFMSFSLQKKNTPFVSADTPYVWLENATYPVTIDPTLNLQVGSGTNDGVWAETATLFLNNQVATVFGFFDGSLGRTNQFTRFTSVTIPPGSTINNAFMTLNPDNNRTLTTVNAIIRAIDEDDAAAPTTYNQAENATRTTANTTWSNIGSWTAGVDVDTPAFTSVVQEIIDRPGWASGNALVIYIEDNGSTATNGTVRDATAYTGSPTDAAKIEISYTAPSDPQINFEGVNMQGVNIN